MKEKILKIVYTDYSLRRELGRKLFELRAEKGLRLWSLSNQIQIPVKKIEKIEMGVFSTPKDIKKLCEFHNKTIKLDLIDR